MNSFELGSGQPIIENKKPKEINTPEKLALALGYVKLPKEKGDFHWEYRKLVESGITQTFKVQNSKYSDERGVRITLGAIPGSRSEGQRFKEVTLCQDKLFDDDMKAIGLVTRTSAGMFYRPELTPEVYNKLLKYIKDLEESGFFEDLVKPKL